MSITKSELRALREAIKLIGGQHELARQLGISQPAIACWYKHGVPIKHVLTIEKLTGGRITRYQLKGDLARMLWEPQ